MNEEVVKRLLDKAYPHGLSGWCPDPSTLQEPDRPFSCPNDCNLCLAHQLCNLSEKAREPEIEEARKAGMKEGIRLFAWWKDGIQYVGTCGTTLKDALDEIDGKYISAEEQKPERAE